MPDHKILELSGEDSRKNRIRLAQRTVETYPFEWIVVHEGIQNARDAIQKSSVGSGQVIVVLNLSNQEVTIEDNGKGCPHKISLLGLGGTDKDEDPDHDKLDGFQGVGLKAVILSTKKFVLESVVNNKKWVVSIDDAYKYVTGEEGDLKEEAIVDIVSENGTKLVYSFPDKKLTNFLNQIFQEYFHLISNELCSDAKLKLKFLLEYYFRAHSYMGNVNKLLGMPLKNVKLNLKIIYNENDLNSLDPELKSILTGSPTQDLEIESKHWDVEEIITRTPQGVSKPTVLRKDEVPEAGDIGRYNDNYIVVGKSTTKDQFKSLLKNSYMRSPPEIGDYETFFDQIKGIYFVIGSIDKLKKYLVENPKQFIAANGIPSAHLVAKPTRGGEIGYASNIHFVISLKAKLNYGKQTITNRWLIGKVNSFFTDAYRATLKNIAKRIIGKISQHSSGDELESIGEFETDLLGRNNLPISDLSFIKEPFDENALIAIFFELLGKNHLKDYRIYTLNQKTRYDGRGVMKLSNQNQIPEPSNDSDIKNIEFKLKITNLIADFDDDIKDLNDLALIIVWENDFIEHPDYDMINIENSNDTDRRIDGVTKCIVDRSTGKEVQVLVIKEFLDSLSTVSGQE